MAPHCGNKSHKWMTCWAVPTFWQFRICWAVSSDEYQRGRVFWMGGRTECLFSVPWKIYIPLPSLFRVLFFLACFSISCITHAWVCLYTSHNKCGRKVAATPETCINEPFQELFQLVLSQKQPPKVLDLPQQGGLGSGCPFDSFGCSFLAPVWFFFLFRFFFGGGHSSIVSWKVAADLEHHYGLQQGRRDPELTHGAPRVPWKWTPRQEQFHFTKMTLVQETFPVWIFAFLLITGRGGWHTIWIFCQALTRFGLGCLEVMCWPPRVLVCCQLLHGTYIMPERIPSQNKDGQWNLRMNDDTFKPKDSPSK